MKKRKVLAMALCMSLVAGCLVGCDGKGEEEAEQPSSSEKNDTSEVAESSGETWTAPDVDVLWSGEWYEPYDKENKTEIHIAKRYDAGATYVEGESLEDNYLVNYFEDQLNVEYVYDYEWDDDTYEEKINLMIADGELPDVFMVNGTQLYDLIQAGLVEDVSSYYEQYASPNLKAAYDGTNGIVWQACKTSDGAQYAMPALDCEESSMSILWVRADWMENLGLDAPETLEDVKEIALAFRDQDPDGDGTANTTSIMCDADYYANGSGLGRMNPLFNLFGAYPEYWYYDESGELVYGSVQPEIKEALTLIKDLIDEGVIEKNFSTNGWDNITEAITTGKCGIFFAPWWYAGTIKQMTLDDPSVVWNSYLAPVADDGTYSSTMGNVAFRYCAFRKGVDEATIVSTIKTCNLQYEMDQDQGVSIMPYEQAPYTWRYNPIDMTLSRINDKQIKAQEVQQAVDGELDPETLVAEGLETYNSYVKYLENGWEGLSLRDLHLVYHFMVAVYPMVEKGDDVIWVEPASFATTETMSEKWATLEKLETETFTKIMMGELPVDEFDSFVEEWMSLGGADIIEEMRVRVTEFS